MILYALAGGLILFLMSSEDKKEEPKKIIPTPTPTPEPVKTTNTTVIPTPPEPTKVVIPTPTPTPEPVKTTNTTVIPTPQPAAIVTNTNTNNVINQYDSIFKKIGNLYGVPWFFLKAIAGIETNFGTSSNYKNKIVIYTKRGITGISENTFKFVRDKLKRSWTTSDLWKPEVSIEITAYLFKQNAKTVSGKDGFLLPYIDPKYNNTAQKTTLINIIKAYNIGAGNLKNPSFTTKGNQYYTNFQNKLAIFAGDLIKKESNTWG